MEGNTVLIVALIAAGAAGIYFFVIRKPSTLPTTTYDNKSPAYPANTGAYPTRNTLYDDQPKVPAMNGVPLSKLPPTTVDVRADGTLSVTTTPSYARGLLIPKGIFG